MEGLFESLCPVLIVDAVEPAIKFWERLGFAVAHSVPLGETIGWVMLVRDGVTIQYQSRASVATDLPGIVVGPSDRCPGQYVTVKDVNAVEALLRETEPAFPRRKTFYGASEIFYRDPAGYLFVFAMHE